MHQTKDVQDPDRRAQMQFFLLNIMHMAKSEDMFAQNYNKLKAVEEGEEINLENMQKRVALVIEKGGPTILHAHLKALAAGCTPRPGDNKKGQGKD